MSSSLEIDESAMRMLTADEAGVAKAARPCSAVTLVVLALSMAAASSKEPFSRYWQ